VGIGVPAVFRCFSTKRTAAELSFLAEICVFSGFDARKNSETPAVLSLFSAVIVEECNNLKSSSFARKSLQ
jgi:hypothetical protein